MQLVLRMLCILQTSSADLPGRVSIFWRASRGRLSQRLASQTVGIWRLYTKISTVGRPCCSEIRVRVCITDQVTIHSEEASITIPEVQRIVSVEGKELAGACQTHILSQTVGKFSQYNVVSSFLMSNSNQP